MGCHLSGFPGVNPWTGVFLSGLQSGLPVVLVQSYSFLFQGPTSCFVLSRPVNSFAALLRAIKHECHNNNDSVTADHAVTITHFDARWMGTEECRYVFVLAASCINISCCDRGWLKMTG